MHDAREARTDSSRINRDVVAGLLALLDVSSGALVSEPAGRTIIRRGEVIARLPLVVSGTLDAVIHLSADDGNQVVPVSWGTGELAMVSYLFTTDPATVDVVVSQQATFRWLPIEVVEHSLIRNHELLVLLVRYQSRRLREVQGRELAWLERGVHERVCARLARIFFGMPVNAEGHVVVAATHESLAARCGVSRPRLSEELKQLEDAGRLKLGRGTIEVLDRAWFDDARW